MAGLVDVKIRNVPVALTIEGPKVVDKWTSAMMTALGDEAVIRIDALAGKSFKYRDNPRTGRYQAAIAAKPVTSSPPTVDVNVDGVVYGNWIEGTSSRNQSTRFKGYRIFRTVMQEIERDAGKIIDAELRRLTDELGDD